MRVDSNSVGDSQVKRRVTGFAAAAGSGISTWVFRSEGKDETPLLRPTYISIVFFLLPFFLFTTTSLNTLYARTRGQ